MSQPVPVRIRRSEDGKLLLIAWSDGRTCQYPLSLLRKKCPCAVCTTEAKSKGPFYIPLYTADAMTLSEIKQQGHYALQLIWADGHHTGIYDFAYLRGLCPEASETSEV